METSLKVTKIKLVNAMLLSEFDINPDGKSILISGKNHTGKSSAMQAILSALSGGKHDPDMAKDKGDGQVIILLNDGTEIKKTFNADKSSISVTKDNMKSTSPVDFIKSLTGLGTDPGKFLLLDDKKRIEIILNSPQPAFSQAEYDAINEYASKVSIDFLKTVFSMNSLTMASQAITILNKTYDQLYKTRTDYNNKRKTTDANITSISSVMPDIPADLESQIEKANADIRENTDKIIAESTSLHNKQLAVENKLAADIEALRQKAKQDNDALRAESEKITEVLRSTDRELAQKLSGLESYRNQKTQYESGQSQIETLKSQNKQTDETTKALDIALSTITKLKQTRSEALSVLGKKFEITSDNKLLVDGIPFDKHNTAQRVEIAMAITAQTLGTLRFVVIDDAEHFDRETMAAIQTYADANDIQLFLFKKDDDCDVLTAETINDDGGTF